MPPHHHRLRRGGADHPTEEGGLEAEIGGQGVQGEGLQGTEAEIESLFCLNGILLLSNNYTQTSHNYFLNLFLLFIKNSKIFIIYLKIFQNT